MEKEQPSHTGVKQMFDSIRALLHSFNQFNISQHGNNTPAVFCVERVSNKKLAMIFLGWFRVTESPYLFVLVFFSIRVKKKIVKQL